MLIDDIKCTESTEQGLTPLQVSKERFNTRGTIQVELKDLHTQRRHCKKKVRNWGKSESNDTGQVL